MKTNRSFAIAGGLIFIAGIAAGMALVRLTDREIT